MSLWIRRLERAQLLIMPGLVGLVGILQASARGSSGLQRLELLITLFALVAPLFIWIVIVAIWRGTDAILFTVTAMLTSVSVVLHFASAQDVTANSGFYEALAIRQAIFIALGYVALVFGMVAAQYLEVISNYPYTLALCGLLLTATTILLGTEVNGARLWLELGPLRFQPGELSRLMLTTFIAIYLFGNRHHLAGSWRVAGIAMPAAPYLLPLVVGVVGAIAVLAFQNDLGMAASVGMIAACFAAGAMWSRLGAALTLGSVLLTTSLAFAFVPRVQSRAEVWLDPWSAPTSTGYQFVQAEFALGEGGIAGSPSFGIAARVPEYQTDFVLTAIGAQFGVTIAGSVLCLVAVLILRCTILAVRARSEMGTYVGIGITLMLGIQTILIVGGTLRLLPLTGLTVPLVSYGGTSMLVTLFALGVILGIGTVPRRRVEPFSVKRGVLNSSSRLDAPLR